MPSPLQALICYCPRIITGTDGGSGRDEHGVPRLHVPQNSSRSCQDVLGWLRHALSPQCWQEMLWEFSTLLLVSVSCTRLLAGPGAAPQFPQLLHCIGHSTAHPFPKIPLPFSAPLAHRLIRSAASPLILLPPPCARSSFAPSLPASSQPISHSKQLRG